MHHSGFNLFEAVGFLADEPNQPDSNLPPSQQTNGLFAAWVFARIRALRFRVKFVLPQNVAVCFDPRGIADNQLAISGAAWDEEMLRIELAILHEEDYNLALVGFDDVELQRLLEAQDNAPGLTDADAVPEVQPDPVTRLGELWLLGNHRLICGDCTDPHVVAQLLGDAKPQLLITDPPYGIELDSEWRDRAGLNGHGPAEPSYMKHRTAGHTETTISGDTRADWSEAYEHVLIALSGAMIKHNLQEERKKPPELNPAAFLVSAPRGFATPTTNRPKPNTIRARRCSRFISSSVPGAVRPADDRR